MKKLIPILFTCVMLTVPICWGQDFQPGPVRIEIDRDVDRNGVPSYTINVTPWRVDVENGGNIDWYLDLETDLDPNSIDWDLIWKRGPWGRPIDLASLTEQEQQEGPPRTDRRIGPIRNPTSSGKNPVIVPGQYSIKFTITEKGKDPITIILDPDHRVWP